MSPRITPRLSNSASRFLTPGTSLTVPFLNASCIKGAILFIRVGNSALILMSSHPTDRNNSARICGSVMPPVRIPSRLTSRPYRWRIAATGAVSGGLYTSVPSTSNSMRCFTNILYALLLGPVFRFIGEVVRVASADYLARLCAIGWADDAALFEDIHQPRGACVADTKLALQI